MFQRHLILLNLRIYKVLFLGKLHDKTLKIFVEVLQIDFKVNSMKFIELILLRRPFAVLNSVKQTIINDEHVMRTKKIDALFKNHHRYFQFIIGKKN